MKERIHGDTSNTVQKVYYPETLGILLGGNINFNEEIYLFMFIYYI